MKVAKFKNERGMTIIEVTIAMAVLAVAGGALVSIGLAIVAMTTSAKMKTRATALANDRVEQLRACRDAENSLGALYNCPDIGVDPLFTRTTTLDPAVAPPGDEVIVTIEVSWNERRRTKNVRVETKLSQWKIEEATQ